MAKGLVIQSGTTIDANWKDRMIIDRVPVSVQPVGASASLAAGGSLPSFIPKVYVITAIGINGESISSAEVSATPTPGNQTIDLVWTAQIEVEEYHIYRGTNTGVYDGYFRVFSDTGTWSDDGAQDMVTVHGVVPPTINAVQGVDVGGYYVGQDLMGLRSIVFFSEITIHNYTFQAEVNNGIDIIPQLAMIHLKKTDKTVISLNLADVIYPTTWNVNGSDSGLQQAIIDIQAMATTP